MMNSEIATSVMMGLKLDIVVLDNRGFGCINRLQQAVGDRPFNNLLADVPHAADADVDFAAHARSLGAAADEGRQHRRAGGRPRPRRRLAAHPCHRHRDRSRASRPRKAVPGGTCRWPRSLRAARSAGPMPPMPRRCCAANRTRPSFRYQRISHMTVKLGINPIGWTNDCMQWLGDFITARAMPHRGEARPASAASSWAANFRARPSQLGPILEAHGLSLVSGWYSAQLVTRDAKAEIAAMRDHLTLLAGLGSPVMVFAETTGEIINNVGRSAPPHGPRSRPPRNGSASASASPPSPTICRPRACAWRCITIWAPSSRSAEDVDRLMENTRPRRRPAARYRPYDLRRRRSDRASPSAMPSASSMSIARTSAAMPLPPAAAAM